MEKKTGITIGAVLVVLWAIGLMLPEPPENTSGDRGDDSAKADIPVTQEKIAAKNTCATDECWGSAYQRANFVETPENIQKFENSKPDLYFSYKYMKDLSYSNDQKGKWFADWWTGELWAGSYFSTYSSKEECYREAANTIIDFTFKPHGMTHKDIAGKDRVEIIADIQGKLPFRCYPGGTKTKDRWNY